jgi:hypothetical protein
MKHIRSAMLLTLFAALPDAARAQDGAARFDLSVASIFRWKPGGLAWNEPTSRYRAALRGW